MLGLTGGGARLGSAVLTLPAGGGVDLSRDAAPRRGGAGHPQPRAAVQEGGEARVERAAHHPQQVDAQTGETQLQPHTPQPQPPSTPLLHRPQ